MKKKIYFNIGFQMIFQNSKRKIYLEQIVPVKYRTMNKNETGYIFFGNKFGFGVNFFLK